MQCLLDSSITLSCVTQEQGHKNKNFPIRSSYFRGSKYVCNSLGRPGQPSSSSANFAPSFDRSLIIATGSIDKVPCAPHKTCAIRSTQDICSIRSTQDLSTQDLCTQDAHRLSFSWSVSLDMKACMCAMHMCTRVCLNKAVPSCVSAFGQ